ncbi:MAG: hypothetical protein CML02_21885 [Pseudooceanicola sp.]|jgi:hypothetical protein|nr:hypothetical protein [Pseudooceanicola sp.]
MMIQRAQKPKPVSSLSQRLLRLAATPGQLAAERRALPDAPSARLLAVLREIDETVLPRCVDLCIDRTPVARLTISQRRLVRLELARRGALRADPSVMVRVLADALASLAAQPGAMSMVVRRRAVATPSPETACSVAQLRLALSVDLPDSGRAAGSAGLARLAETIDRDAKATCRWPTGQAPLAFAGASEWTEILARAADGFRRRDHGGPDNRRFGSPRTDGLALPLGDGQLLILAAQGGAGLAAVMPEAEGMAAIAHWQRNT